ncbi:MAG: hypothetical protein ACOYNL_05750 [Rickettsiales bacterium]
MMRAVQKTFSDAHKPKTFVELVSHNNGAEVHVVRTYDHEERPCWFLLKADGLSLVKLERTTYKDIIDLAQYGEVMASGWGHEPYGKALILQP